MKLIRVVMLVGMLVIVSACTDDTEGGGDETTVGTILSTTTIQPDPTTSTTSASTTVPSTPTTVVTDSTTSTTLALPPFPAERQDLTHGGDTWVVILAASEESDDPVLQTAENSAQDAGYNTGATDCDIGASTVLGLPEETHYYTVSVYLSSEADAVAALDAFEARGVEGTVGVVQTFCMD